MGKSTKGFSIHQLFESWFGMDPRSLQLFRILFGLVSFYYFAQMSVDITEFFSDFGMFPRQDYLHFGNRNDFSINNAMGATWFQTLIFAIAMICSLGFMAGYKPRLMAFIIWILAVSIQNKNYYIGQGGDTYFRMVILACCFMPFDRIKEKTERLWNVGTAFLIIQVVLLYVCSAFEKSGPEWVKDFSATWYALYADQMTKPPATILRQYPGMLKIMTMFTYYLELYGPLLLFIPRWQGIIRTVIPLSFIGFHFSTQLTMELGAFAWIGMMAWLCLLPRTFWNLFDFMRLKVSLLEKSIHFLSMGSNYINEKIIESFESTLHLLKRHQKLVVKNLGVAAIALVFIWNIIEVKDLKKPDGLRNFMRIFRLDQSWTMFAPRPIKHTYWFVGEGLYDDGRRVNILNPTEVGIDWYYENVAASRYQNFRWRKLLFSLFITYNKKEKYDILRHSFGKYLCKEFNTDKSKPRLKAWVIYKFKYPTKERSEGMKLREAKYYKVWRYYCNKKKDEEIDWDKFKGPPKLD